ncbi:MAG: hypothetical protein HWN66_17160 [Candidatus Helarchaeota archaeon]|nr:hypothetical protein [Candidatus Helarchaeota archaeon]
MVSIKISKDEIKEYEKLKITSQLTLLKEKITLFEKKYSASIEEFKQSMSDRHENFEEWDDYIEWKAAVEAYNDLKNKLAEIENAKDIQVV